MRLYYLDSSAWIKRYCAERGSDRLAAFFAAGPAIGCAALGLVEVLCTLARKARARELSAAGAASMSREARRDFALFHKVFLTPRLLASACDCAQKLGLRGADTVHLASCLELRRGPGRARHDVVLISSDAELLSAVRTYGIVAVDPERTEIPPPAAPSDSGS